MTTVSLRCNDVIPRRTIEAYSECLNKALAMAVRERQRQERSETLEL